MMKFKYIDALRGIAILSVIWFHCHLHHFSNQDYYSLLDFLGSPAALGVQLFYVVSAFTLFLSLQSRENEETLLTNFFIRRYFRIAPMYYLAIIYYTWQISHSSQESIYIVFDSHRNSILANLFMLHGLSPVWINAIVPGGWSVGIEVLFYLLIPVLYRYVGDLNGAVFFTSISLLLGFALTALLTHYLPVDQQVVFSDYLFFYLPFQLPVFGCGIIAYYTVIQKDQKINKNIFVFAVATLFTLFLCKILSKEMAVDLPHTLHFLASFGFILLIVVLNKWPYRVVVNRLTTYIGKISYSAYLSHFAILYWADKLLPTSLINVHSLWTNVINFHLKFLVVTIATVLISSVTFYLFERPLLRFGSRFIRQNQIQTQPVLSS